MKKFIAILFSVLLSLATLHSKDLITADYLQTRKGPWACLEGELIENTLALKLWKNEKNAFLEKVKDQYYLFSRADSIFIGEDHKLLIIKKDDIDLLNQEREERIKNKEIGTTGGSSPRPLPRPFALKGNGNNNKWTVDLTNTNKEDVGKVVIIKDWPHACPACSLVFSKNANPSLEKDSIFVARDSSSFNYRSDKECLVLDSIKVTKDENGPFVRIDKIEINGEARDICYKTRNSQKPDTTDAYTLDSCYAEVAVEKLKVQDIKDIRVEYSFLNDKLEKESKSIQITFNKPSTKAAPVNLQRLVDIICYFLFGLMVLTSAALLALLLRTPKKAPEGPGPGTKENEVTTPSDQQIQTTAAAQQQTLLEKTKQEKDALVQENEVLKKNYNDLQAKIAEFEQRVIRLMETAQNIFGEREDGEKLTDFISRKGQELKDLADRFTKLEEMIRTSLGAVPDGMKYSEFFQNIQSERDLLAQIRKPLSSYFGSPQDDESYDTFFSNIYEHIRELERRIEDEKANSQRELTQKLEEQKELFEKQQQQLLTAHQEDTRLFCDTQLTLLNKMKSAYQTCIKSVISSSKFGRYVRSLASSLDSFLEMAEPIFKETTEEDCIASLSEKFSLTLRRELRDHTSWLNTLIRLEAYARTEVLRKPMLEDGIDLTALTEFFYAAQELLRTNFYTINPLPALFIDTNRLEDFRRDNMDSVISSLFNYKEVLKTSAIVDIIQIGYSYKNDAATQTTITYYVKPVEINN